MDKLHNEYAEFSTGMARAALFLNSLGNYGTMDMNFDSLDHIAGVAREIFDVNYTIFEKSQIDFGVLGRVVYNTIHGQGASVDSLIQLSDDDKQTIIQNISTFKPVKLMVDGGDTVYLS